MVWLFFGDVGMVEGYGVAEMWQGSAFLWWLLDRAYGREEAAYARSTVARWSLSPAVCTGVSPVAGGLLSGLRGVAA